jgi:transcriptional regulator with XRE-family HTH domain
VTRSVETLSNAERGASLPSLELFFDLARVLEIEIDELMGARGDGRRLSRERVRLEAGAVTKARALKDEHLRYWLEIGMVFERGKQIARIQWRVSPRQAPARPPSPKPGRTTKSWKPAVC